MDYRSKYVKYKRKYLNLTKNKIKGGIIDVGFLQYIYKHILKLLNIDSKSEKKLLDTTNKINKSNTDELKYWTNIEEGNKILSKREDKIKKHKQIKKTNEKFVNILRDKAFLKKQKEEKLEKEQTNNKKSMIEELKLKQKLKRFEDFKTVNSVKYLENIKNYIRKLGDEDNIILEESLLTIMKKILKGNKFRIVMGREYSNHEYLNWVPDLHYIIEIIGEDNKVYTFGLWPVSVEGKNIMQLMFPDYEYITCSKRFEKCVKQTKIDIYKPPKSSKLKDIENKIDCNEVCLGLEGINEDRNNLKFKVVYDYEKLNYYQLMIIYYIILNAKLNSKWSSNLEHEDNFFYWMTNTKLERSSFSHFTNACSFVSGSNISDINCQTFGYGFKNTPEYTLKVLLAAYIKNDNKVNDIILKLKSIENDFDNSDYYLEEIIKLLGIERNKINELKVKEAREKAERQAEKEAREEAEKEFREKAEREAREKAEREAKLIEEQKKWEKENIEEYIKEIKQDISKYEKNKSTYNDKDIINLYETLVEFESATDDYIVDNDLKRKITILNEELEGKLKTIKIKETEELEKIKKENWDAYNKWEKKKMNNMQEPKVNTQDPKPKPKPKLKLMKKKQSSKITKPKRETSPGKDRFKPQTKYEIYHKIAPRKLTDEEIIIFDEKEEKIEKLHEDFYTNEEGINNIMVSETLGMTLDDYKKTKLEKLREETKKKEKLIMTEYYEKMDAESLGMTLEEYRKHIEAKAESLGMTVEEYKKMEIKAGLLGMRVEEYMDYNAAESLGITLEKYKEIKTTAELMGMTTKDYIEMMGLN